MKLLIVTTTKDISAPLFFHSSVSKHADITFCLYLESETYLQNLLKNNTFDAIYLRDPFTEIRPIVNLDKKIQLIIRNRGNAYLVDKTSRLQDIYFEDKWTHSVPRQYLK